MKFVNRISRHGAVEEEISSTHTLRSLYDDMRSDLASCQGTLNFDQLWAKLAPAGNVYRFNALQNERLRHCEDLGKQMDELADGLADILGGNDVPLEERHATLVRALKATRVLQPPNEAAKDCIESGQVAKPGFPPLEEFVADRTVQGCFFVHPAKPNAEKNWYRCQFFAAIVFMVQTLGPLLMACDNWYKNTNYLRDLGVLWRRLSLNEILCVERSTVDWCTLLMGTIFMELVLTQLLHFCEDELRNIQRTSHMLPPSMWTMVGNFANATCAIVILIMMPVFFWAMDNASSIIIGSMSVLFVFSLDDFCGVAGSILRTDDATFQRSLCWHYALLTQCPVNLRDLVNPEATTIEDVWQIEFDAIGLLAVGSSPPSAANGRRYCATRIAAAVSSEESPLVCAPKKQNSIMAERTNYRVCAADFPVQLPGYTHGLQETVWRMLVITLKVLQFLQPPLWLAVNKPCLHPVWAAGTGA